MARSVATRLVSAQAPMRATGRASRRAPGAAVMPCRSTLIHTALTAKCRMSSERPAPAGAREELPLALDELVDEGAAPAHHGADAPGERRNEAVAADLGG